MVGGSEDGCLNSRGFGPGAPRRGSREVPWDPGFRQHPGVGNYAGKRPFRTAPGDRGSHCRGPRERRCGVVMDDYSPSSPASVPQMRFGKIDDLGSRVAVGIDAARKFLFSQQHEEGYWCGELEADTTLESDYILLHTLFGTGAPERFQKAARYILNHQNADGGWSIYAGGPSNISASVKAYFGLKLAGYTADHPALQQARKKILELGGVTEVNTFTKIYLCFFGQYDYDAVPAIPPEIVLFPNWFWFNIYEISSWSRAILVPLSICYAKKPFKKIPDELGVEELFVGGRDKSRMHLRWDKKLLSWRNFFLSLDRLTHWAERVHIRPLRTIALRKAEKWMLEHFEMSDGLGAIYPSMMNAIIALRCLGYSVDDPQVIRAIDEFEKLGIEEDDTFRMQPCMSPVWDTAYALFALGEAGIPANDARLVKCADWILQKQVRTVGDWKVKNPEGQPGGWYFEFNNEFYPDVDDSAMLDPPTVDITGRILECLATYGYDKSHPAVKRALKFIRNEQEPDGSWFGRWGVNYIYGTALVLRGLEAMAVDNHEPMVQQAAEWLRMVQNTDGGWGETVGSYDDPNLRGTGDSTASQTAWAILGLLAAGDTRSDSVARGIAHLLRTQKKDGAWDEPFFTGTGFPRVFYLAYHLYRQYFPLIALTTYAKVMKNSS